VRSPGLKKKDFIERLNETYPNKVKGPEGVFDGISVPLVRLLKLIDPA
jgi:hypothetical protein